MRLLFAETEPTYCKISGMNNINYLTIMCIGYVILTLIALIPIVTKSNSIVVPYVFISLTELFTLYLLYYRFHNSTNKIITICFFVLLCISNIAILNIHPITFSVFVTIIYIWAFKDIFLYFSDGTFTTMFVLSLTIFAIVCFSFVVNKKDRESDKYKIKLQNQTNQMQEIIDNKTKELSEELYHEKNIEEHILLTLAEICETRDTESGLHNKRTALYVNIIAKELQKKYTNITDEFVDLITQAAPLHDFGKIAISDVILNKPAKLTLNEFEQIKLHTIKGYDMIDKVFGSIYDDKIVLIAKNIAYYHHEKWDGSGYPQGLKGDTIPLEARIMAVADVFDALISKRCYKEAFDVDEAFRIIYSEKGKHFDPHIVDAFMNQQKEIMDITTIFKD